MERPHSRPAARRFHPANPRLEGKEAPADLRRAGEGCAGNEGERRRPAGIGGGTEWRAAACIGGDVSSRTASAIVSTAPPAASPPVRARSMGSVGPANGRSDGLCETAISREPSVQPKAVCAKARVGRSQSFLRDVMTVRAVVLCASPEGDPGRSPAGSVVRCTPQFRRFRGGGVRWRGPRRRALSGAADRPLAGPTLSYRADMARGRGEFVTRYS